jgi:hypothetical protein
MHDDGAACECCLSLPMSSEQVVRPAQLVVASQEEQCQLSTACSPLCVVTYPIVEMPNCGASMSWVPVHCSAVGSCQSTGILSLFKVIAPAVTGLSYSSLTGGYQDARICSTCPAEPQ